MAEELPQIPFLFTPQLDVLACGMPDENGLKEAAAFGVKTLVNVCPSAETPITEPGTCAALGMEYITIPVTGLEDLNRANVEKLANALNTERGKVLVHCRSSNRVGALFALKAFWLDGKTEQEAIDLGRAAGLTKLEDGVRYLMQQ